MSGRPYKLPPISRNFCSCIDDILKNMPVLLAKYLILVFPLFSFYLLLRRKYKVVLLIGMSVLVTKFLAIAVGFLVFIPRPFILYPELPYYQEIINGRFSLLLGESGLPGDSSFFSAHAATSFAAATVIYLTYGKKVGMLLLSVAGLIAAGRVLVNVHYPIDVIVGGTVGIFTALTISTLCVKLLKQ